MNVLADIYVSSDDEAVNYDATPDRFANRAQYKGITPFEISMLWAIMRDIEWNVALMDEFRCLLLQDGGERLIHCLPTAMVNDLSELTLERITAVSLKWATTEELGWPIDEARAFVVDIESLARKATESGRGVYLWNCIDDA